MVAVVKVPLIFVIVVQMLLLCGCSDEQATSAGGKPAIVDEPEDVAVSFGDSAKFVVGADGEAPLSYQWYKSGQEITGATDSVLLLKNIVNADSGVYQVTVSNDKGLVSSSIVHLKVSGGEPVIGRISSDAAVASGDSIILAVQVAGNRPFAYKWYVNDMAVADAGDSVLAIGHLQQSNSGKYKVVVSNALGADTSTIVNVTVNSGKLFVMETDFQSGVIEWLSIADRTMSSDNLSIYRDAAVRSFGGYLYILERFGADNIVKFDPSKNDRSGVLYQKHLGDNWNPQDIEFVSATKAYIANMNEPSITIFNPLTGSVVSSIDIARYTFMPDSNTTPCAADLLIAEKSLYVMLQRRNGFNPGATTLILKVDVATDAVTDTISLHYKNGYAMAYADGALYVTNPGGYETGDGAIEKVVLSTKEVSTVIDEAALGGNPNAIIHKQGSRFYITTYVGWKDVRVQELDATSGSIVATVPGVKDAFGDICYDATEERLYVGERDSVDMGIKTFKDNIQVGTSLKTGNSLPPSGLVIVR